MKIMELASRRVRAKRALRKSFSIRPLKKAFLGDYKAIQLAVVVINILMLNGLTRKKATRQVVEIMIEASIQKSFVF